VFSANQCKPAQADDLLIVGQAHVVAARLNDKPVGSRSAAILKLGSIPDVFWYTG
jgi:hypothetical protein